MNIDMALKSIQAIMRTEAFRQCAVVALSMVTAGIVFAIQKRRKNETRKLLTITDLKKRAKRFKEVNYSKSVVSKF